MGWYNVKMQIFAKVSRHNSPQDWIDVKLWEEFTERIKIISDEEKYKSLELEVRLRD